jgi:DNA-binding MarR family transcriptional regulator
MATKERPPTAAEVIARDCIAVRVRALNRAVTSLYDDALRPLGLRVGQLNLLVAVARMGTARPGDLCRLLRMEKSTLSRDVEVMRRNGWLEVDESGGGRVPPPPPPPAG